MNKYQIASAVSYILVCICCILGLFFNSNETATLTLNFLTLGFCTIGLYGSISGSKEECTSRSKNILLIILSCSLFLLLLRMTFYFLWRL